MVVADDHPLILSTITELLSVHAEIVATATDGRGAIEAAKRLDPDVVVLDIKMPGLDGLQTAEAMRAAGIRARIIFLSAHIDDDVVAAGRSAGASGFVLKARARSDLISAVEHVRAGRIFLPSATALRCQPRATNHVHALYAYNNDASLVRTGSKLFLSAWHDGGSVIAVLTEPHLKAFEMTLQAQGVSVSALVSEGRYIPIDVTDATAQIVMNGVPLEERFTALFSSLIDRAANAVPGATRPVITVGEMAPTLFAAGRADAAITLERIASDFATPRSLDVLCPYRVNSVSDPTARAIERICAEHSAIVAAEP